MKVTAATASLFLSILCIVDGWQYWEQPLAMSKPNKKGIYEFDLRIEHALTMTMKSADGSTPIVDFSPDNQVWSQRDPNFRTKCSQNYTLLDASDEIEKMDEILATVLQWDGKHHKIVTVSGKSPGQPIVVPLDAKIQLRLHNLLLTESVTLHVHGMSLRNGWWNDGVPFVQQCPIGPGAVYTYRFVADTPGTQWFHGHLMGDRSTGLLGGFVVLRPDERTHFMVDDQGEEDGAKRANLTVGRQYLAILQDRNPQAIQDAWLRLNQGLVKWAGYQLDSDSGSSDACIQPENAGPPRTGPFFGFERLSSVLVNQKGWHNQDDIRQRPSQLPLANFAIKNAENVLLRLINGASMQSYYVWLEKHPLWVVAADGYYVKPKKVDSLLIHPGERYDILVRGFSTLNRQLFRFIFDSFDHFMANISTGEVRQTVGLANLRYEDSDGGNRTAKFVEKTLASQQSEDSDIVDLAHKQCSGPSAGPCQVLNCPHAQFYTGPRNYTCLTNDQLENAEAEEETLNSDLEKIFDKKRRFHELMLNVHAGLNGWYYKMPAEIPYFHQGNLREIAQLCDPKKCDRWEEECRCFHHYEFGLGDIVQITVSTYANMPHPFHIHGTKFYVLKTGLMGDNYALNEELQCAGANKYCLELKWKNASYSGGHIPNMNKNPVLRDTVLVPNKGYVVIRFVASNPGWFFAHCHLLFHNMDGMAFAYKVDAASGPSILPKPPANFPRNCGHFDGGEEEDDEQPAPLNGSEGRMQNAGLLLCHVFIVLLAKFVIHFNK